MFRANRSHITSRSHKSATKAKALTTMRLSTTMRLDFAGLNSIWLHVWVVSYMDGVLITATIWLVVVSVVTTLAFFFLLVENDHLMRAILVDYFFQYPPPRPLFWAIHVSIHLIVEPLLISIRHLLFVDLRVVDKAHGPASRLGRRRCLKMATSHLLLFCKFESIRWYCFGHDVVLHDKWHSIF